MVAASQGGSGPVGDPLKRPAPVGFGPLAPHWQPRCDFAGTYDQAWQQDRYPVLRNAL